MAQVKQMRNYSGGMFPNVTFYSRSEIMNPIIDTDLSFQDPDDPEFKQFTGKESKQLGTGKLFKWFDRHKGSKDYKDLTETKSQPIEEMKAEEPVAIQEDFPIELEEEPIDLGVSEVIDTAGKGISSNKHNLLRKQLKNISKKPIIAIKDNLEGLLPSEILMYNLMKK